MLKESFNDGFAFGKRFGLVKGYRMWTDQHGMGNAIGAIVIFTGVIICLYLSAIVVGSFGTTISTGGIVMSSRWNNTVSSLDSSAASSFSMANVLPIAIPYRAASDWLFKPVWGEYRHVDNGDRDRCLRVSRRVMTSVLKSGESYASTALSPANTYFFRAGRIKR